MSPTIIGLIVAALGAIFGPVFAYLTAARKLSGRVATTAADDLWAESKSLRDDYRAEIEGQRTRQARLEERVANLEERNTTLARENVELRREAAANERTILALREHVDTLERENSRLTARVAALEEAHGHA